MAEKSDDDRVWEEMEKRRSCMMVDQDGEGLRARPMAQAVRREDHAVWFVSDRRAHKDDELRARPDVCLTYGEEGSNFWMSVSGRASVVDDRAKAKEIWGPGAQAWFPGGPEDPNVILLRVTPERAEFWDGPTKPVAYVKMLAASVTGTKPDMGENKKVSL